MVSDDQIWRTHIGKHQYFYLKMFASTLANTGVDTEGKKKVLFVFKLEIFALSQNQDGQKKSLFFSIRLAMRSHVGMDLNCVQIEVDFQYFQLCIITSVT